MEQRGRELNNWEEIIEKVIETEAKAGLRPASYVRNKDHRFLHRNCPVHTSDARV